MILKVGWGQTTGIFESQLKSFGTFSWMHRFTKENSSESNDLGRNILAQEAWKDQQTEPGEGRCTYVLPILSLYLVSVIPDAQWPVYSLLPSPTLLPFKVQLRHCLLQNISTSNMTHVSGITKPSGSVCSL